MEVKINELEGRVKNLEKLVNDLLKANNQIKHNEFVGLKITDNYCNGFFGRDFRLDGSIIIENSSRLITIRKPNGEIIQADMEDRSVDDIREYVFDWTSNKEDDE